jgi:hypothetical protein
VPDPTANRLSVSPAAYYADPCTGPSLNASTAKTLITRSPLHAWQEHPRLGGAPREATAAQEHGSLIHRLVLGAGDDIEVIDAPDWRTKAAKEQRDDARTAGRIPVLVADHAEAEVAARAIADALAAFGIDLSGGEAGESEVMLSWHERSARGSVLCRGMLDRLVLGRSGIIYDLKTTPNAHPQACARRVADLGYDIQAAAYTSAVEKLRPDLVGRVEFVFVFAETEPPYCVTPMKPGGMMREFGLTRWQRAVEVWAACLADGRWPGYVESITQLELPPWVMAADAEFSESLR